MPVKRPIGRNNLDKALHRLFKDDVDYFEMRSMMANVLVGQFLPEGVVKGGSFQGYQRRIRRLGIPCSWQSSCNDPQASDCAEAAWCQ